MPRRVREGVDEKLWNDNWLVVCMKQESRSMKGKEMNWRVRYAKYLRAGNVAMVPIYIFFILVPLFYEWETIVPPDESLLVVSGTLTYRWNGTRHGVEPGVLTATKAYYFTCRNGLVGSRHDCPNLTRLKIKRLIGKPAKAWWFKHKVYPMKEDMRLVRLVVGGEEVLNSDNVRHHIEEMKQSIPWYGGVALVFFIAVALYLEKIKWRIDHG